MCFDVDAVVGDPFRKEPLFGKGDIVVLSAYASDGSDVSWSLDLRVGEYFYALF